MPAFPFILTFAQLVSSPTYTARVHGDARVLVVHEDGEWSAYGVEPGGMCSGGSTPTEAAANFRIQLTEALQDLVELSPTLKAFEREHAMFASTNEVMATRWQEALTALRASDISSNAGVSSLPRKLASSVQAIVVTRIAEYVDGRESFSIAQPPRKRAA